MKNPNQNDPLSNSCELKANSWAVIQPPSNPTVNPPITLYYTPHSVRLSPSNTPTDIQSFYHPLSHPPTFSPATILYHTPRSVPLSHLTFGPYITLYHTPHVQSLYHPLPHPTVSLSSTLHQTRKFPKLPSITRHIQSRDRAILNPTFNPSLGLLS